MTQKRKYTDKGQNGMNVPIASNVPLTTIDPPKQPVRVTDPMASTLDLPSAPKVIDRTQAEGGAQSFKGIVTTPGDNPAKGNPNSPYGKGTVTQDPQTTIDPVETTPPTTGKPVTSTPPSSGTPVAGAPGANNPANYLLTLPGLSDGTKQALGNLMSSGYQPSQAVTDALNELNKVISNQPAAFQSQYFDQLNNVMNQILGREAFSYDLNSDPMYQQYRDQYMQSGKQAMQDTIGQAAALTGGYGSSYATTAGSQAYQQHLGQLNEMAPQLYQMALQQYQMTGDQLQQQYGMLNDMYQTEYGQYQDDYNRWLAERDYAQNRYTNERDFNYGEYRDKMGDWRDVANWERDQYNNDRNYYYDYAMQMIQAGKMPSQEIIDMLGLSRDDLKKLKKYYKNQQKGSGGSSGSSSKKSSSSGSSGNYNLNDDTDDGTADLPPLPTKPSQMDYDDYIAWLKKKTKPGEANPATR